MYEAWPLTASTWQTPTVCRTGGTIWSPPFARFHPGVARQGLHNKLHLPDAVLHNKANTGIARAPIVPSLLPGDIALLKQAMVALVPQWLGGWDAASDPLRKL